MAFKFERLEIWRLALELSDAVYDLTSRFPKEEQFNLTSQSRRAATSVGLNIAEGSTGQTDAEQVRFLGFSLRSVLEVVACLHMARRRGYVATLPFERVYKQAEELAAKIQAMRKAIAPERSWVRENNLPYLSPESSGAIDEPLP